MSENSLVNHISDTALWVAIYRAMETESPEPLFRDPYARRLAGERGEQIVKGPAFSSPRAGSSTSFVRTARRRAD